MNAPSTSLPPSSRPQTTGTRLVAYLRDSGGREQNLSIPQQEAAVGEWCLTHGYILTRVFKDIAKSGLRTSTRDQFLDMVSYLETSPPETGVIFWEYARLSRDYDDLMYYVADLRRMGYVLYSITDQIPEGLEGRLLESIIAWKNAKYSEDLSKNIKRGHRYLITVHKAWTGGKPPTGYRLNKVQIGMRRDGSPHMAGILEPDPEKAPLVVKAFEMRSSGATLSEIHDVTHLFDWVVIYGKMLRKTTYMGTITHGGIEYPGACLPLVSKETWLAAQRVNQARQDRFGYNHPRAVRSRFFLTGLLFCGRCGMTMNGRVTHQRKPYVGTYYYYRCQSQVKSNDNCMALVIPKEELEGRVLAAVRASLLDPVVLTDLYNEAARQLEGVQTEWQVRLNQARSDLQDTRREISNVVAAIRSAGHSAALLLELDALERKEAELDQWLFEIEASPPGLIEIDPYTFTEDTSAALDAATDIEKGIILRGFIHQVTAERVNGSITGEVQYYIPGSEQVKSVPL